MWLVKAATLLLKSKINRLVPLILLLSAGIWVFCFKSALLRVSQNRQSQFQIEKRLRAPRQVPVDWSNLNPSVNVTGMGSFCQKATFGKLWKQLCLNEFPSRATMILSPGKSLNIIQVGAHNGWEENDPFAQGITSYLESLSAKSRKLIHYTFVEASPANYKLLEKNVQNNSHLCTMKALHGGVVPDTAESTSDLKFYSIKDTVDVETGLDSVSGKKLPYWITQISSFSKETMMIPFHKRQFLIHGLNIEDYIEETQVPTFRFSELMSRQDGEQAFLVLIDTEGYDCDIVAGIAATEILPQFLIYEFKHCTEEMQKLASDHLSTLGYTMLQVDGENMYAYREN
jgi:FkbM family methyltransferase